MTTPPTGPENDQEDQPEDSEDDDRPYGISHITTPAEMDQVDSVDWEQIFFGLENRTSVLAEVYPRPGRGRDAGAPQNPRGRTLCQLQLRQQAAPQGKPAAPHDRRPQAVRINAV